MDLVWLWHSLPSLLFQLAQRSEVTWTSPQFHLDLRAEPAAERSVLFEFKNIKHGAPLAFPWTVYKFPGPTAGGGISPDTGELDKTEV